jgi:hypothetical protein
MKRPRPRTTNSNQGRGAASALGGGFYAHMTETATAANSSQTLPISLSKQPLQPILQQNLLSQPQLSQQQKQTSSTSLMTATQNNNIKAKLHKTNPISGLPPRHHLKLTQVRLKALEEAQIKQAKRHMKSKAKLRHGGHSTQRSTTSSNSTSRTSQESSARFSKSSGRSSSRSRKCTARSQINSARSSMSTKSWSSSISFDSQTSNLTEKAMDRIIKLEKALEREKMLRTHAEEQLELMSSTTSSIGSSIGSTSSRRPL